MDPIAQLVWLLATVGSTVGYYLFRKFGGSVWVGGRRKTERARRVHQRIVEVKVPFHHC